MDRAKTFILILIFLFTGVIVFAQSNRQIPKGFEVIKIGGSAELVVPKSAKTRKVGAQVIVEGTKEYVARRFEEMDERLTAIEQNQEIFRSELESLKAPTQPPETQLPVSPSSNSILVP